MEKGKKVATVSAGLFENFIKIGNKHVLCELILGKTVPAWLRLLPQRQLDFLALDYTYFYMNFCLRLTITKFY